MTTQTMKKKEKKKKQWGVFFYYLEENIHLGTSLEIYVPCTREGK